MWWRWQHQCVYATGAGSLWFQESELCGMSELWRRGKGLFWNEVGHAQPKYRLMSHDSLPSAYSACLVSNFREDLSAAWAVSLTQQPIRALQKNKRRGRRKRVNRGFFSSPIFHFCYFLCWNAWQGDWLLLLVLPALSLWDACFHDFPCHLDLVPGWKVCRQCVEGLFAKGCIPCSECWCLAS